MMHKVADNFYHPSLPKELRKESNFLKSPRGEQNIKPTAALICDFPVFPKIIAYVDDKRVSKHKTRYEELINACHCLTLVGPCSPTPVSLW